MSIKEVTGPGAADLIKEALESDAPEGARQVEAAGCGETDPVAEIASELAAGRISTDTAVDRLIEHTMDASMVGEAPSHVREELAFALKAVIETDPHLRSLVREMDAG